MHQKSKIEKLYEDYCEGRKKYERAKMHADACYSDLESIKSKMIDEMLNSKIRAFDPSNGECTRIGLRREFSCSVTKENTQQIRDWLLTQYGDDMPFVKEVVDKAALIFQLKKEVEEANFDVDDYPEFLKVSTRPNVVAYGWKNPWAHLRKETTEEEAS